MRWGVKFEEKKRNVSFHENLAKRVLVLGRKTMGNFCGSHMDFIPGIPACLDKRSLFEYYLIKLLKIT